MYWVKDSVTNDNTVQLQQVISFVDKNSSSLRCINFLVKKHTDLIMQFFLVILVLTVARTCSLIFIVLDVLKPLGHKRLIEYELEGFGIR